MPLVMNRLAMIYKELLFATGSEHVVQWIGPAATTHSLLHRLIGVAGMPTERFVQAFNQAWRASGFDPERLNTLLYNKETGAFSTEQPTPMYFTLEWLGDLLSKISEEG